MTNCQKNKANNTGSSSNTNYSDKKSIKQQAIDRWENEGGGIPNLQVDENLTQLNIDKEFDCVLKAKLREVLG